MNKNWDSIRSGKDAPDYFVGAEATAWALGYNAAVQAYREELDAAFKREQQKINDARQAVKESLWRNHKPSS